MVAASAALVLVLAAVGVAAGPAGAAKKPVVTAEGSVRCGAPVSGTGTVRPPYKMTAGVGTRSVRSTVKMGCTGTVFNGSVTPISARIVTRSTSAASTTCTSLQTPTEIAASSTIDITWKASGGKINPTHIAVSTTQHGSPAMGSTLPGPTGTATVTGSFAGETPLLKLVASDSLSTLTNACLSKGIKKLHFGNSSSFQIGERAIPTSGRYSSPQYDVSAVRQFPGIQYRTAVDYTGATIPLLLDVYTPPAGAPSPRPTVILIHGGAFVGGSRTDNVGPAKGWAARGFDAVSIDYRLDQRLYQDSSPPKVAAAAAVATSDAESAVRWIKANAATYGFDVNRIAAVGNSAGGAIALAMSAAPDADPTGPNLGYSSKIQSAVSTGAYLTPALDLGTLTITSGLAPIQMFHYETDVASNTGPYAFRTCQAYRDAGSSCEYISQPGEGHTTDLSPGGSWWTSELGPFLFRTLRLF
jgi:dienelactone hydrolase